MKNLQLQIYLLICSQAIHGLKTFQVELGENVMVHCDLVERKGSRDLYWYTQRQCSAPKLMLRIFFPNEKRIATYFYNAAMKQKISVQLNHSLLIHNITEEELGDYYCVAAGALNFSTGTRLYRTESSSRHVNPQHHTPCLSLSLASAVLNCIFIAAIVALLICLCKRSPKSQTPESNLQQHRQQQQDLLDSEYAQVEFLTPTRGPGQRPSTTPTEENLRW